MKTEKTFDPSDLFYDLGDLSELIKGISDVLRQLEYVRQDGSRIHELDRVTGMLNIAGRDAERLYEMASVFDGPYTWAPMKEGGT